MNNEHTLVSKLSVLTGKPSNVLSVVDLTSSSLPFLSDPVGMADKMGETGLLLDELDETAGTTLSLNPSYQTPKTTSYHHTIKSHKT